ncbi:hypothetical protein [Paenibacillus peoriae]|uniref:hypothetical protein n=1 Tax=Paenibacillus peoriae TaxID=59893 RepID=UPI00208F02DB|nr:hypothetical protein [Paenibacillus peoriae]
MVKLNGEAKYCGCNKRLNVQSEIKITRKRVTFFQNVHLAGYGSLTYRLDFTGTGVPFLNRTGLLGILRMLDSADLEGNAVRVFFDAGLLLLVLVMNSRVKLTIESSMGSLRIPTRLDDPLL